MVVDRDKLGFRMARSLWITGDPSQHSESVGRVDDLMAGANEGAHRYVEVSILH